MTFEEGDDLEGNLCMKFMSWVNYSLPSSLGIWENFNWFFPDDFKKSTILYQAIASLDDDPHNEEKFIRAIFAAESIIKLVHDSELKAPLPVPPPIEGLESLYNTMRVMDA